MSVLSTGAVTLAPHRVAAMVLRYLYLLRSSWTRLLELIYWPAVQLLVWGFLQFYIAQNSGFFARATGVFIAAVLMWDILFRGQLGFSVSFLEEMWSRNLTNLMISPLRPIEFVCALMIMSLIRLAIGMLPVTFLAMGFFGFNVYALGLALAAFFVNLILTSWAVGIVVAGVDLDVRADAAHLRLLSGQRAATLAASDRLGAAAHLCVRGDAGAAHGARDPHRPDARGVRAQRALFCRRRVCVSAAAQERASRRLAAADRRVAAVRLALLCAKFPQV